MIILINLLFICTKYIIIVNKEILIDLNKQFLRLCEEFKEKNMKASILKNKVSFRRIHMIDVDNFDYIYQSKVILFNSLSAKSWLK